VSYGAVEAVKGIDLEVVPGEVFAFLGPNGAGKTSTVEVLEGFRRRRSGHVRVLGEDPDDAGADWRSRIGVVLQESAVEPELTVSECVALYAGYYPHPRSVTETLDLVGLAEQSGAFCGRLSGGQRRRLDVALALVGGPELLFLDEPTTGFDPTARRAAWDVIAGLRQLGTTILLTTHYMDEAEFLADRIAVIAAGRIVAEGTPATLGGRDRDRSRVRFTVGAPVAASELPSDLSGATVRVRGTGGVDVEALVDAPLPALAALAAWAAGRSLEVGDLEVSKPTLEDVYLRLTAAQP